jgi:NhaP-type Na+/H+ or K+/H+ antiporter
MMNSIAPLVLASSGGHGYLYGLFFLIIALVIGAATRHFLKKVPLPFTVLLLLIGLAMGYLNREYGPHGSHHSTDEVSHQEHAGGFFSDLWVKFVDTLSGAITWGGDLDGHLILYVFLPILIFEAGFALDVHTFKKSFLNAFYLAGPGIVTATVMTGLSFYGLIAIFGGDGGVLAEWNVEAGAFVMLASMLFGAVVSATDPVAVVALLKDLGASKKLGTLIEGESLLNDGTAIVAFVLLFGVVTGAEAFLGTGAFLGTAAIGFGKIGAAGGLLGVVLGLIAILWVRKVFNDPMIEVTVILVTSFAVFFICEHFFHVSGVLGLVALGIVMAGVGKTRISPEVEHFMHEFWELVAFVANVIIFIVVGVVIAQKVSPEPMDYAILGFVYLAIHLVRGINMGIFYPLMRKAGYGLPPRDAIVVWWGALRGAIGLALALVVYSEHLRYEFDLAEQGEGYNQGTTSVVLLESDSADRWERDLAEAKAQGKTIRWNEIIAAHSIATPTVVGGKIVSLTQSEEQKTRMLGSKTTQDVMDIRDDLKSGKKKILVVGEGSGVKIAGVSLVGISAGVRGQFLFLISGIVLLTLLVNATTVGALVNALGLTKLPAVKKLMFSNASGNVAKGCEQEMDLLKDDRFLSGANWGLVRNYLPDPVAYPLTADELAEMDTLAEIRRRLLERERSSYWAQFRSGLLSARAVALLDNNLSEFLDQQGKVPMTERDYLEKVCGVSKIAEAFREVPLLKGYFSDLITISYDCAKAFVVSQQDIAKMVDTMAKELDEGGDPNRLQQNTRLIKDEIRQNRLAGLQFIRNMHENYPEATVGIETKDAIRSVLNHERNSIRKLRSDGMLEADEADRLITEVEERMKEIMESPLELRLPEPEEVLREVTWLKGMSDDLITKITGVSEARSYGAGDSIMKQGDDGDGMIVITRGSVKVSIGDLIVDIMGRGAVIGEMAVLAGIKRTANVVADSSVTALWLSTASMQEIMVESPELSGSLWKTAAMRFSENLLGAKSPYNQWDQMKLRRWLNDGELMAPADGETVNLYGKVAVLIAGQATAPGSTETTNAPALLDLAEAQFSENAKVFVRQS